MRSLRESLSGCPRITGAQLAQVDGVLVCLASEGLLLESALWRVSQDKKAHEKKLESKFKEDCQVSHHNHPVISDESGANILKTLARGILGMMATQHFGEAYGTFKPHSFQDFDLMDRPPHVCSVVL